MNDTHTSKTVFTLRDERGMTIMELLVASFIGLFVVGTVFAAVRVQGRSAAFQTGLADAQLTSRGAGELLLQDLRMAGFGMLGVSPDDAATFPPLSFGTTGGVTTLQLRGAFNNVTTTVATAVNAGATSISVTPPAEGAFQAQNLVLIDSGLSSEIRTITSVGSSGGNVTLGLSAALAHGYPIGPFVTQIEVVTYVWSGNVLTRNNQVVAENVPVFDLDFIDQDGVQTEDPGDDVRSVIVEFQAAQAASSQLGDNPTARSRVDTEANMRNLAFRFDLS
ncbi:MAG: hypothetical protein AB1689_24890 [Thermodesulfobacteriota bacterium]